MIFKTKNQTIKDLESTGFTDIKVFGDWENQEGTYESKEFLFIAYK